jgi:hypothetical protein
MMRPFTDGPEVTEVLPVTERRALDLSKSGLPARRKIRDSREGFANRSGVLILAQDSWPKCLSRSARKRASGSRKYAV